MRDNDIIDVLEHHLTQNGAFGSRVQVTDTLIDLLGRISALEKSLLDGLGPAEVVEMEKLDLTEPGWRDRLQSRHNALREDINALEERLDRIESQIANLEKRGGGVCQ